MRIYLSRYTRVRTTTRCIAYMLMLLISQLAHADSKCVSNDCQNGTAGEFVMSMQDGSKRNALLLDTQVAGEISGMVASVDIIQSFRNDSAQWISGRYVFPLPEGAAVDSLKIQIGDRVINGIVQEKKQAQKTFQKAKKAGKKAGLLKQHRPNLFSISVANIAPQETINVSIHYVDTVLYENQTFSMRFPTTLTPRYIPGTPLRTIELSNGVDSTLLQKHDPSLFISVNPKTGWATNTSSVADAIDITPPQTHAQSDQTTNLFSFKLTIKSGLAMDSVSSTSHPIRFDYNTSTEGKSVIDVTLDRGKEPMNQDLLLSWKPSVGSAPKAALFKQEYGQYFDQEKPNHYSMIMVVPPVAEHSISIARDITFIIDSSGSMAGTSMQQAKESLMAGLSTLTGFDKFNVVDFDSEYRPFFIESVVASVDNIAKAMTMISHLSADGGTEMFDALDFALSQPSDETYLKQVIFITDGSIGNEAELFKLINEKLGGARLFTIGIGSAPNSHFMNKAAKYGRGSFTYVSQLNQVNDRIQALFAKINRPRMRNIEIDWPFDVEQYPKRIPDLYAGEPILVIAKSDREINEVSLRGQLANQSWKQTIKQPEYKTSQSPSKNLNTLWARKKIQALTESLHSPKQEQETLVDIKHAITDLGIKHKLVTKFTSFVAVEDIISRPQSEKDKHHSIANLMPKGSTMPAPSTATARQLYLMSGGLLLLLALFLLLKQWKYIDPQTKLPTN